MALLSPAAGAAAALERCVRAAGGVAVFPADTVYGLCCDPENGRGRRAPLCAEGGARRASRRGDVLRRSSSRSADARGPRRAASCARSARCCPGPVTLLLPNRGGRFPLACGPNPGTLGLRVPLWTPLSPLWRRSSVPVMQSSANLSGGARRAAPRAKCRSELLGGVPTSCSTAASCRGRRRRSSTCARMQTRAVATCSGGGAVSAAALETRARRLSAPCSAPCSTARADRAPRPASLVRLPRLAP